MLRKLPPLNALKAFESAARHESFRKAADELGVTQGAISKQVIHLENHLGLSLFDRCHQKVDVTPRGAKYYDQIGRALDLIEQATSDIREEKIGHPSLVINCSPTISTYWLIPRIDSFQHQYPEISFQLDQGDGPEINFLELNCNVAIRALKERPRNRETVCFMEERMCLVYSPKMVPHPALLNNLEEASSYSFLQHSSRPSMIERLIASQKIKGMEFKKYLGFEHFFMIHEAVREGLGLALLPDFMVSKDVENGRLISLSGMEFMSGYRYYALCKKSHGNDVGREKFLKWLVQTALKKTGSKM